MHCKYACGLLLLRRLLLTQQARIAHHVRAHGFRMAAHISFGLSLLLTIPWLAWLCVPATDQAWLKSFNLLGAGLAAQAEASSAPFVLDRPGFSAGLVLLSLVCVYVNWSALLMLPSPANFRLYTPNKRFFVHHATILYVCCLEYGAMALCCAVFALPQTWVRLRALGLFLSVLAYIMSVVGCACEVWTRRGVAWEEMWEAGLAVCQRGPWTVAEGGTKKPKHRISRLMLNFQTFDQKTLFWSIQAFLWIGRSYNPSHACNALPYWICPPNACLLSTAQPIVKIAAFSQLSLLSSLLMSLPQGCTRCGRLLVCF